jgi:hypothetical protein
LAHLVARAPRLALLLDHILPQRPRLDGRQVPVIGLLGSATAREWAPSVAAFLRGLSEAGFAEGRNVAIEGPGGDAHDPCC